jgi:hypothetical protein
MQKSRPKKKPPKRVLALPDLEQTKSAVLSTLTSKSGQQSYDHAINEFVDWYCSEPRLAFNRTVVLRYRIFLEQRPLAPLQSIFGSLPSGGLPMRPLTPDCRVQSWRQAFDELREFDASACESEIGSPLIRASDYYPLPIEMIFVARGTTRCSHFLSAVGSGEVNSSHSQ